MEIILPDIFNVVTFCTEKRIQRNVAVFLSSYMYSLFPSFLSHFSLFLFLCLSPFCFLSILSLLPPSILLSSLWFHSIWEVTYTLVIDVGHQVWTTLINLCAYETTWFVQWHHSTMRRSLNVELCHFKASLVCFTREKACSLQKQLWDLKILPFSQAPAVYYWSGKNGYLGVLIMICLTECTSNLPSDVTRLCHCQATPAPLVAAFGSRNSPFQQDIVFQLTQDFIGDDIDIPDLFRWLVPAESDSS